MNETDTIHSSRSIIRCLPSSLFLDYVSLLADAFVRAAAGLLARGGHRAVEPGNRGLLSESYFMLDLLPRAMSALEQYPFGLFSDECCDLAQHSS